MILTPGTGEAVVATRNDIAFSSSREAIIPEILDPSTSLSADIAADSGEIAVADAADLPDFGIVVIEGERIAYERKEVDTLIVATDGRGAVTGRGQEGTTAAAHSAGARVEIPTALPDCAPTRQLLDAGKTAVFFFLPEGCTPGADGDCQGVRAIVIALDDLGELTDSTLLYSCRAEIKGDGFMTCPEEEDTAEPFLPAQTSRLPTESGRDLFPTTCFIEIPPHGHPCIDGDCDADGETTLGEVQTSFNVFLGTLGVEECLAADTDYDETVSLGEVQEAFNRFLGIGRCF